MNIQKVPLTKQVEAELITMSTRWEGENSCFGYRANTADDLAGKEVFLAQIGPNAVGYLLCNTYVQEKESCTVPKGSKCLEIQELYILPEYRSQGIGKALYQAAAASYDNAVDYVTLSTATKDHRAILHFYIDELGMTFWSARLFQKR